jgi:YVTN family beta-propeller protein/VCBS repeat-containing protein
VAKEAAPSIAVMSAATNSPAAQAVPAAFSGPLEPLNVLSTLITSVLTGALNPLLSTGPSAPMDSPALLALLAWTRRQGEQSSTTERAATLSSPAETSLALTAAAAVTAAVAPAPTAPPTVGAPNATTGVVTGSLNVTDADGNPLTYTVTTQPTGGSVTVSGGTFTYTPTQAARLRAATTTSADFDNFVVSVSDGTAAATVNVSVPVLPAQWTTQTATTVGTGTSPYGVAVSPNGTRAYVTNLSSNTVSVINTATNAVVATINVGATPLAVAVSPDNSRVYVAGNNTVTVINTATNTVVGSPITTGGGQSYGIAVSPNGTRVYITQTGNNRVVVLNTATNTVVTTVAVGSVPGGVAVSADNSRVYVANYSGNTVSVINTATNTVVGSPIAVGANPFGIAVNTDGRVYVANAGSGTVSVINTTANNAVTTVAVGTQPWGLTLRNNLVFVATADDKVAVLDTKTNTVISTTQIDTAPEFNTHVIAVSPDGRTLYVSDLADTALRVLPLTRGNTAPTVNGAPTVGTPNTTTGAVSGSLNVTDWDGDTLGYTVTTTPTGGNVTVNTSTGAYTYTPTTAARQQAAQTPGTDTDTFTVRITDPQSATTTVTVTVPISPQAVANRPPVASAAPTVGTPNTTTGVVTGVLNATDPDGNPLTYTVTTPPAGGSVTVNAGTYTYTPTAAARQQAAQTPGPDTNSFTVNVSDGQASINVSVTVPVLPANRPPAAQGPATVGTPNATSGVVTGALNVTDPDGNPLTYTVTTPPAGGSVTVNAGTYTYTPTAAARQQAAQTPGPDTNSFTVNVSDGQASINVSVTVPVLPAAAANQPPAAQGPATVGTPNATTGVVSGSLNVTDPDGNPLTYTVTGAPAGGSVTVSGGNFTYTPTQAARLGAATTTSADFDSFVVSVSDGSAAATVNVSVPVLPAQLSTQAAATVGNNPYGVAVSPNGTRTYVVNQASNTVSVIDTATNAVVATINVGATPTAVAVSPDNSRVYVAGNNTVSVINTATNTVIGSPITTGGGQSYGIAVSPNGTRVYITQTGNNGVVVLNTATNAVVTSVAVGAVPAGIAVSPDSSRVYVANYSGNTVSVINTATNTVVGSPITVGANPFGVAISPNGTRAYVTNTGSGTVSVINTATNTVVATVAAGSQPWGLVVSPDNSTVYVATGDDKITLIDTKTNAAITTVTIDTAPEFNTHTIAISPDGRTLYVSDFADRALRVLTLTRGNTAPTVNGAPTVGTPNTTTGAVTGSLNVTDYDGDTLGYTVTTTPTGGGVTVNTTTGTYTYTPTAAARQQAAQTPGADTDTFTVRITDGQATTNVTVITPITPAGDIQSTPYLPFDMSTGQTDQKVFAHYVPWFPSSLDNLPADQDYYTTQYLNPAGEGGAHAAYGGYLRDRPLPRDPINDPDWRYVDALTEVNQAKSVGIDGFAIDIVGPGYHDATIDALYRAAQATPGFKIQPTADMAGPMSGMTEAQFAAAFAPYLTSTAAYRLSDGRVVLGAFMPESKTPTWWTNSLGILRNTYGVDVAFVPTFVFDAYSNIDAFAPFSYGFSNWGGRNPLFTDPTNSLPGSQVDLVRKAHALGKIWMQPVAFQDNRPREGIYEEAQNSVTNSNSWQIAINEDAEWVQLLTWNDYAEMTTMAPSVEHGYRMLDMQAYYIAQYKYGLTPTVVRDALYVSHRSQFADSQSLYADTIEMQIRPGTMPAVDNVEVVVFATAPATVYLTVGGVTSSCSVGSGRSVCTVPLREGTVSVSMVRGSTTVTTVQSPYIVTNTPFIQDLEYNVAGGLR